MSKEYSNEEFGFGSSAYGESAPQKQEEKIAKSASTPAKIQRAAVTAVAPAVEAASVSASESVAPPLPPLPTASAGAPPAIQNPVQTADFWSSALKGVGIPVGIGLAAGAAGGLLAKRSGGGGSPAGSVAPTVDEDLRQLRLAQEQAKLDAIYEKNYRQQQLHEANLAKMQPKPSAATPTAQAGVPSTSQQFSVQQTPVDYSLTPAKAYGQQNLNVPTGAPNVAAPPPAEVAPAAVAPKPVSEIERLRIEKAQFDLEAARAKEARAAELHASRLAADAKRAEAKNQTKQGTPAQSLETTMQKQSYENTVSKAVDADMKAAAAKKAPPAASVVPPAATPTAAPIVESAPATAPKTSGSKEISLPKDWPAKGMNWITSQYGEEGARQFIQQYNNGKPFKTHDEMKAVYDRVMTKPSYSSVPKSVRQERGITASPERQQYKIVPNAVVPPSLPSGGGGGGMVVPRGSLGNIPGANEQIHSLNPMKL